MEIFLPSFFHSTVNLIKALSLGKSLWKWNSTLHLDLSAGPDSAAKAPQLLALIDKGKGKAQKKFF